MGFPDSLVSANGKKQRWSQRKIALGERRVAGIVTVVLPAPRGSTEKEWACMTLPSTDQLRHDVAAAMGRGEFFLAYQPEIDLTTHRFAGVEALVRWQHSSGLVLAPATFWPWLQDDGLIPDVGRWVLTLACEQGADWFAMGYRFSVAVNCSAEQLLAGGVVSDVVDALDASRFPPTSLSLEFSLATLQSPEHRTLVRALRDIGVGVTADNVPVTHEALATLPADLLTSLKLDRAFVGAPDNDVDDLRTWARGHGIRVVASGLEDDQHTSRFRDLDVDGGQGFGLAQPVRAEELTAMLEDYALFSGRPL